MDDKTLRAAFGKKPPADTEPTDMNEALRAVFADLGTEPFGSITVGGGSPRPPTPSLTDVLRTDRRVTSTDEGIELADGFTEVTNRHD